MWAVLGRDGQLMSEQETLLYLEVMMMMIKSSGFPKILSERSEHFFPFQFFLTAKIPFMKLI
jgi:hypothetical protein